MTPEGNIKQICCGPECKEEGAMARVLVTYHSRSGNTEAMAKLVAEGAREAGAQVSLKKAQDVRPEELARYEGIIVGSPTYYGAMAAELKSLIDESVAHHGELEGKAGGAFTSSANVGGGNETTILGILQAMLIHGMVIQGDPDGDHYGPVAIGAPDERSKPLCKALGKRVAALAQKLSKE
jgi:NAD(P)H dehydrogenase (quinone)